MEAELRLARSTFHCASLAQRCVDVLSRFATKEARETLPRELEARVAVAAMTAHPAVQGDAVVAALEDDVTAMALEELDLSRRSNVKDAHLYEIAKRVRNLRVLCLDELDHITGRAFANVGVHDDGDDAGSGASRGVLEQLNVLSCNMCERLDGDCVERIAYGCPSLREAHFYMCKAMTTGAVHALASQCTELRSLDLTGCASAVRDEEVRLILTSLPNLRVLNLGLCYRVTDAGIASAVSSAHHAPLFSNIETLDLSGCCHLTDVSLRALGASAVRLRHLNLAQLDAMTDDAIVALFEGRCGSTIESLVLDQCDSLSEDFLFELAKNDRAALTLKDLSVSFLNITDEAVFALMDAAARGGQGRGTTKRTAVRPRACGQERNTIRFHGLSDCPGITVAVTRKLLSYLEEMGAGRGQAACLPTA